MSSNTVETEAPLTQEERLKAIVYQFIKLYERWSEDRQEAAKQGADLHELVKTFTQQVEAFGLLEKKVRLQIAEQIQAAASQMARVVGKDINEAVSIVVDSRTAKLMDVVDRTDKRLKQYEKENSFWTTMGIFVLPIVVSVCVGAVVGRWVAPAPTLPMTSESLQTYQDGRVFEKLWPKLSKQQRQWLLDVLSGKVKNRQQPLDGNL